MNPIDWFVMFGTLGAIVTYGVIKSKNTDTMQGFLLGNRSMPWWTVCLSIMATQASAVTFLSTPGQAFDDGMRFLQFYFGLPLAMIILCVTVVPLFHRLKVYTAYEYLESRFDLKVRSLAAFIFLMLRGLSVGITVFAPSLILSTLLEWNINLTTVLISSLVMIYTISGGSKAVSLTQKYQLTIIMTGMLAAGAIAFFKTPDVSFVDTFGFAGALGKMNLVDLKFDINERYNIWSGLIGALFLFLAYFGTDQSQVGRYLAGSSVTESRLGLIFNGLLKIPMQFIILYIGILVFVFYQFNPAPLIHNQTLYQRAMRTESADTLKLIDQEYAGLFEKRKVKASALVAALKDDRQEAVQATGDELKALIKEDNEMRATAQAVIGRALPGAKTQDRDYVFINFVMTYLPHGLIGLLMAIVFSAAMSSTASELNALTSATTVDIYKRSINKNADDTHYVKASKWFTVGWAVFAMIFASLAGQAENLIQFVNIIGSLFYGTLLGIFITAFFVKYVKSNAVFVAAIISELIVIYCYKQTTIAFLLYNIIGSMTVVLFGILIQFVINVGAPSRQKPGAKN
jgi:Na+/proline symporter